MMEDDFDPRDMPPGTKVWAYARHSPGDNQTIDSQVTEIENEIRKRGWILERDIFKDEWASGSSTENRKEFRRMLYLATQTPRPAEIIVIWQYHKSRQASKFG